MEKHGFRLSAVHAKIATEVLFGRPQRELAEQYRKSPQRISQIVHRAMELMSTKDPLEFVIRCRNRMMNRFALSPDTVEGFYWQELQDRSKEHSPSFYLNPDGSRRNLEW